jgi:hypothetical protein
MQGIWPIRRRWRGPTRCMGMVWERKGGRERKRQLDRQAIGQSVLQSSKACLEHGAAWNMEHRASSIETGGASAGEGLRLCLHRSSRAHCASGASCIPRFSLSRRPCYSPVSFRSPRLGVDDNVWAGEGSGRHTDTQAQSCLARLLASLALCCCCCCSTCSLRLRLRLRLLRPPLWPCIYTSSLPRPSRGPRRRRATVDCGLHRGYAIKTYRARCIAAWRHGGMAASLHRSSLHPSIPLCALAPRSPGLPCSPSERLRPLPLCTPRRLGRRPVSLVTGLTRPDRPDQT